MSEPRSTERQTHVIVVDDRAQFPTHVWRTLTGVTGFLSLDSLPPRPQVPSNRPVYELPPGVQRWWSADCLLCVWWVMADTRSEEVVHSVLEAADPARNEVRVLLDVKGRRGYDHGRVADAIKARYGERVEPWHVSAYAAKATRSDVYIRDKELELLSELKRSLEDALEGSPVPGGAVAPVRAHHVLVTGAGFEMRPNRGSIGMPGALELLQATHALLLLWGSTAEPGTPEAAFLSEFRLLADPSGQSLRGARLPEPQPLGNDVPFPERIHEICEQGDLDGWWDLVLEHVAVPRTEADGVATLPSLRAGRMRERLLRQAFRKAIRDYDWGYLSQAAQASSLAWVGWLTTNYTHFADRAVERNGKWQTVSIVEDAYDVINWDLHGGGSDVYRESLSPESEPTLSGGAQPASEPGGVGASRDVQSVRHLFKLHGDVAHVQTMAIAGHDKNPHSPLYISQRRLSRIYSAAQQFLEHEMGGWRHAAHAGVTATPLPVVWHILGHGLRDELLVELMLTVSQRVRTTDVTFVIADLAPDEIAERLRSRSGRFTSAIDPWTIHTVECRADEYLARLNRYPFSASTTDPPNAEGTRSWIDRLARALRERPVDHASEAD